MAAVIIGAGPAGLFSALALVEKGEKDIVIIEQGRDLDERIN
ncbi:MAG: NAD(P)-binding domain-containing protein [Deltaproteobacteria bacterium]|nr:NAD(P)-binding domain-containing protein [Deltaproteobacteria bacterium]